VSTVKLANMALTAAGSKALKSKPNGGRKRENMGMVPRGAKSFGC
jgi:hypothetical protein